MSAASDYRAEDIRTFRTPAVAQLGTGWRSLWKLGISRLDGAVQARWSYVGPDSGAFPRATVEIVDGHTARMALLTQHHPHDVDAFEDVDRVLIEIDRIFGITSINDSPRDHWRTFLKERSAGPRRASAV